MCRQAAGEASDVPQAVPDRGRIRIRDDAGASPTGRDSLLDGTVMRATFPHLDAWRRWHDNGDIPI